MVERTGPSWTHFNPVRVTAGAGSMHRLPSLLPELGRVLLVTTEGFARRGLTQQLVQLLGSARVTVFDQITPNPQLDDLDRAAIQLRQAGIGSIVALGGGSVMDAAKVLAITLTSTLDDPLAEVFRRGGQLAGTPRLPLTAIPTTSGTGAEVTPFATIWDQTTHTKHSLAGEHMYPAHALLDPELTLSLPHEETLYPGLDAISHSLESIWNKNRTPISASFALQALSLAAQALPIVLRDPRDLPARSRMQQASLLAGLAISQTRTAVAHSISYPLTSYFGVPHGLACSFTLPELLRLNIGGLITAYPREESLFLSVQRVLDGLRLPELLSRYATPADIMKLQAAMSTKGRIDNFVGDMGAGLVDVIEKSLT